MRTLAFVGALVAAAAASAQAQAPAHGPVIDMHIHAYDNGELSERSSICAPFPAFLPMDPGKGGGGLPAYMKSMFGDPDCPRRFLSAATEDELRQRTIAELRKHDAYGLAGGTGPVIGRWVAAEPKRLMPAIGGGSPDRLPPIAELRRLHAEGKLKALSELTFQYSGIAPDDPRLEPYWSLAEELDIPVGLHMGPGAPGTAYFATPAYRAALGDPLLLEPVLVKHPKLRLFVIHAGYPMKERMLALMAAHPQVYAEFGILTSAYGDSDVWPYLQAFIDAGFEDRVLYGTDQMAWPDLIGVGIERVWGAPGLTRAQKRKFLYENAARFLRIDPAGVMTR